MNLARIVYVEDEDDIRDLTEMALEGIGGYSVQTFSTGPKALEYLEANTPDMILLDVMMPVMDGKELFALIKAQPALSHIPVAFMTAKVLDRENNELVDMGAVGVISKPYDPMTLADDVRSMYQKSVTAA